MASVSELLKEAWGAVKDSGLAGPDVPAEVQAVGLAEAIRLTRGGEGKPANGAGSTNAGQASPLEVNAHGVPSESEFLGRVSRATEVPIESLDRCFFLEDGELRIAIPGVKLGKNNADRTRAIAQLLIIGRGFGIPENETLVEVIRAEVIRQKVYDSPNFSTQLNALTPMGYVVTGTGKGKKLRAKSTATMNFPKLVADLLGAATS